MAKIITYSLKNTDKNSDRYYQVLEDFTNLTIETAESQIGSMLDVFHQWLDQNQIEVGRTRPEYIFDLLVLGVFWQVYAPQVVEYSGWFQRILENLVVYRKKVPLLKPAIDFLRGLLGGITIHHLSASKTSMPFNQKNYEKLLAWLRASGDFKEEVLRLELWQQFFSEQSYSPEMMNQVNSFATWFEAASKVSLGEYTPNVESFLAEKHPAYRWREDYIFTGRRRVEYHLYMVGMEMMNRAFRAQFITSERKIVFVPPCMAAPKDGSCQAKNTPYGARCFHCSPGCQVNQITKYGEKHGVQVFMIPDSFSPLSENGDSGIHANMPGVVGVSCPVTITGGGFEMRRAGIPAQGVLLDHCGCSWHWGLDQSVVTEINFRQLVRTLACEENTDEPG